VSVTLVGVAVARLPLTPAEFVSVTLARGTLVTTESAGSIASSLVADSGAQANNNDARHNMTPA
jgi:hypothetical protein